MKKSLLTWAATLAVVAGMALPVMAGAGGGGFGGAGGAGGGGGRGAGGAGAGGGGGRGAGGGAVDPATQLANIRTAFGTITDPEWNALAPKIQAVLEAQAKVTAGGPARGGRGGAGGGGGGGGGGRGGGGAPGGAPGAAPGGAAGAPPAPAVDQTNPYAVARNDLTQAVATGTTTPDADLKTKLGKLRDERKKASDAVAAAQKTLQPLVTIRQEAILVNMGILE